MTKAKRALNICTRNSKKRNNSLKCKTSIRKIQGRHSNVNRNETTGLGDEERTRSTLSGILNVGGQSKMLLHFLKIIVYKKLERT